jgi:hypothetical protein
MRARYRGRLSPWIWRQQELHSLDLTSVPGAWLAQRLVLILMPTKSLPSRRGIPEQLGIDLLSGKEEELFKWFLACLLFGKPIQREIAEQAYTRLVREKLLSPAAVLQAGWDRLVQFLDDSQYVRYDFSTATKLLEVSQQLQQRYGTLTRLLAQVRAFSQLSAKVQEFKHIGPVTARIFCRGLTGTPYCPGHLSKSMRRLPRKRKSRKRKHYGITRDQCTARSQG